MKLRTKVGSAAPAKGKWVIPWGTTTAGCASSQKVLAGKVLPEPAPAYLSGSFLPSYLSLVLLHTLFF